MESLNEYKYNVHTGKLDRVLDKEVYGESNGVSTTTSEEFQQKLRLSVNLSKTGYYKIGWCVELTNSTEDTRVCVRVQIVDVDEVNEVKHYVDRGNSYGIMGGFSRKLLLAGVKYIDLDFCREDGGTAKVRKARLTIRRVT